MPKTNRPPRGLGLNDAMRRWSDPQLYAETIALQVHAQKYTVGTESEHLHKKYHKLSHTLYESFIGKLRDRVIVASGIPEWSDRRVVVEPDLWGLLHIDDLYASISGKGRRYEAAEFFEPSAVPKNILEIPPWLKELNGPDIAISSDYRNIMLDGQLLSFGAIQAQVLRALHAVEESENPWIAGKTLTELSGSRQTKLHDVFKKNTGWKFLIESNGQGSYRWAPRSAS